MNIDLEFIFIIIFIPKIELIYIVKHSMLISI